MLIILFYQQITFKSNAAATILLSDQKSQIIEYWTFSFVKQRSSTYW